MILVTFSGLDGCGKTTQVRFACDVLARRGLRVYRLVTLFTSVTGAFTLLREAIRSRPSPAVHGGRPRRERRGSGRPVAARRSPPRTYPRGRTFAQDRARWTVRLRRWLVYPWDCLALTAWVLIVRLRGYNAVVCDRYIYDKMVNLPEPDGLLSRLMCRLTPRPTSAIFLDVPPSVAERRRHEHAPDYYVTKDAAYRKVLGMNLGLRAVPAGPLDETQRRIEEMICANLDRGATVAGPASSSATI